MDKLKTIILEETIGRCSECIFSQHNTCCPYEEEFDCQPFTMFKIKEANIEQPTS